MIVCEKPLSQSENNVSKDGLRAHGSGGSLVVNPRLTIATGYSDR